MARLSHLAPEEIVGALGRIEWVEVGTHGVELSVLGAPRPLPALVGRTDLPVHYRFVLRESDGEFELTPVKTKQ